jgi:hypothetical protein
VTRHSYRSPRVPLAPPLRLAGLLCALSLMAACGGRDDAQGAADGGDAGGVEGLPAPTGVRGSVTGMPTGPGPGTVPLPGDLPPDTPVASGEQSEPLSAEDLRDAGIAPMEPGSEQDLTGPAMQDEPLAPPNPARHVPASGSAVNVVRDYYAALNARSYARAHALWADGGRASGQSEAQFAGSSAQRGTMSVGIGTPGAVDASTGMPYVEVPVDITTTYQDGSQRHFRGMYTLRADAIGWRIVAADVREVGAD